MLALAALGRGDVEDAYRHAGAVTAPGRLATSSTAALRVSMDLVEAAVRLRRPEEARRHVQAMRDAPRACDVRTLRDAHRGVGGAGRRTRPG